MPQTYIHRLTKYIHVQTDLGPIQKAKWAIYKACESKKGLFQKGRNEGLVWVKENQEIMMYPDSDKTTAQNLVMPLRQARAQNNILAISVVFSGSSARISDASELILVENMCHQEILGAVVLLATNKLYIWGAKDISGTRQKTDNILNTIRAFLKHAKVQNLNIVAMVTNSILSYALA
ncbi:12581_t:CDS:2, partial [Dentiscutata erythropus]